MTAVNPKFTHHIAPFLHRFLVLSIFASSEHHNKNFNQKRFELTLISLSYRGLSLLRKKGMWVLKNKFDLEVEEEAVRSHAEVVDF